MGSRSAPAAPRSARELVGAAAFFVAVTVLMTWPLAAHMREGLTDLWDAKLSAWIFHWDFVATLRDPLDLFQAPILHPAKYVLAFSENLYGAAVFGFPLLASGSSLVANYNFLLLTGMFLSALSAWALARYVTGDAAASLVAGLVYAFLPYKLAQLAHVHMEWGPFLCIVFLFLLRYLDSGRRRDAALLALFFAWNFIACIQYAFFTAFLVAVALPWEAATGGPGRWRRLGGAILAMAVGGVACLPFAIPYRRASELYQMRRSIGEMTFFSAKPGYFLSAGEPNALYGELTRRFRGYEGDFFPGLVALALAAGAVWSLRRSGPRGPAPAIAPARRAAARACDGAALLLAAVWIASRARPGLSIGPVSVADSGRVWVLLTAAVLFRLALAFPRWGPRSRFASLGDFLRRCGLDRRALLLLLVGATGILVSLGGHTPYYRFLFQSFGSIFKAIRVAARGVVLFQVALAVLAAWGLALLLRGRSRAVRAAGLAGALGLITVEYRAFPIRLFEYDSGPLPVYEWLRGASISGGVVEWPLGFPYDCEYTFRQAEHGKPLVNGHSSFAPREYERLYALVHTRPIPEAVWEAMEKRDAEILVYHPHAVDRIWAVPYRASVREAHRRGTIRLVGSFLHGRDRDFVFRFAASPNRPPSAPLGLDAQTAERQLAELLGQSDAAFNPPFAGIVFPGPVFAGEWRGGWALDDSGIAEIRIASELGPSGTARLHMRHPGVAANFPDFPDADDRAGFGFVVPPLAPGPHTLTFTLVGNDGGVTVVTRPIVVAAPAPTPTPPGTAR